MIKAIIFDLDNTLYDGEGEYTKLAARRSVKAMIREGLPCSLNEGERAFKKIIDKNPISDKVREVAKFFGSQDKKIIKRGKEAYYNQAPINILELYPDTIETLTKLKERHNLTLVTYGMKEQQEKKIDHLKIEKYFDKIYFDEGEGDIKDKESKEKPFRDTLEKFKSKPEEVLVVGDRIDREINIGNKLGMKTVQIKRGKYSVLEPQNDLEKPNHIIKSLDELLLII